MGWMRRRIWQNPAVEWWFAQNMLLFATRDYIRKHAGLRRELGNTNRAQLSLVHPRSYLGLAEGTDRIRQAAAEIATVIPAEESFILVDSGELEHLVAAGRRVFPFPERDGEYWSPPADDVAAVCELRRPRRREPP